MVIYGHDRQQFAFSFRDSGAYRHIFGTSTVYPVAVYTRIYPAARTSYGTSDRVISSAVGAVLRVFADSS